MLDCPRCEPEICILLPGVEPQDPVQELPWLRLPRGGEGQRNRAPAAQLCVSGNVHRMGPEQITVLGCLQASCMRLKGRRKFVFLNQTGNQELGVSCIYAIPHPPTAQTAACVSTIPSAHRDRRTYMEEMSTYCLPLLFLISFPVW